MNYTEITATIQSYLETTETDFVSYIDQFIKSAEEHIRRSAQLPVSRKNVTGTMTSGNQYLSTPEDFLASYSLAVVNSDVFYYLEEKEVSFIREAYTTVADTAPPKYYALFDHNTFILGPTPDAAYPTELHYYYDEESIVDAAGGTTWIGDNAENALLYGALVQGYTYLKGEADLIAQYQSEYDTALSELQLLVEGRNRKDTYTSPNQRFPT